MSKNKSKYSKGIDWDKVWKVLVGIFAFSGSMVAVYELVNYVRSDANTFYLLIIPVFGVIVWLAILVQLFRKKNPSSILYLAVTVLGGVVGGIGWQSYNQTQENKVIVLVAQFDGPEETYGLHDQIMEDLRQATKGYSDTIIIDSEEVLTSGQGNEYARELGRKANADLVIWAWYRPTENPNITIHIENLSPTQIDTLQESETYQPQATLAELESFEIQKKLGGETTTLIMYLTGLVRFEANDFQTALERFESTLNAKDISTYIDLKSLYLNIAITQALLGEIWHSIQSYDKAIELDPNFVSAYNARGVFYNLLGEHDQAIEDFSKAIELDPNLVSAYNNRGVAYNFLGQYNEAILEFNKALEIDPNKSGGYDNRALSYIKLNEYQRALQDIDKAVNLDPKNATVYDHRGGIYASLEQYERALQDFDKAVDLDPRNAMVYYHRAGVYSKLKQYQHALKDFNKAIKLDPNISDIYASRGLAYTNLNKYERATQDFDKAIELDKKNAGAYYNRARNYYFLEQYEHVIQDCNKAIELGLEPNIENAYTVRGIAFYELDDFERAIQDYDKAIEINPQYAIAYNHRGNAYQALGKTAQAEADFKKYEELTGEKP